ncbi:hypothetical protein [Mycobacterium aquaticum]|uniref:hypothetical protein n=1 Tax=Mycobacterium aquaticum TaxID=1927124 RepID=UPI001302063A|nr:hypothetical protein [Mycobacterium aquaticum]
MRSDPTSEGLVHVEAMNPQLLVQVTGEPALKAVADEVAIKLRAALDRLTEA